MRKSDGERFNIILLMSAPMSDFTSSSLEVQYELRPAKQVERWMVIDGLQILSRNGFPIGKYKYTGMGGHYFVDFVMFHKILGIHKLHSVERDRGIEDRVRFNCPYELIELTFESIGEVIPRLKQDIRHIVWLDYDYRINAEMMSDIVSAGTELPPGSILLITVDAEVPGAVRKPQELYEWLQRRAGRHFPFEVDEGDCTQSKFGEISVRSLVNALEMGLGQRPGVDFLPLFNFRYRDGHRMRSFGGVIGGVDEKAQLQRCDWSGAGYVRLQMSSDPFMIDIPKTSRRERLFLDAHMPCDDGWSPDRFEMDKEEVMMYREIYRYYPSYAELLL